MSNIESLPLVRVTAGVEQDEDWIFSLAFFLPDGTTPIALTGITLTLTATGDAGTLYTGAVVGDSGNVATWTVLAAAKASWAAGVYSLMILATDGTNTREVLGLSTLTVGAPAVIFVSGITGAGTASVGGGANVAAIAAALAALPASALLPLINALMLSLPDLSRGDALPASGLPLFNNSDFLAKNQ